MVDVAPWAAHPETSRGRIHDEPAPPRRNPYQRDRDRIVHSNAFRRLMYKTQVFVNHEGDHYRTRLTHSLEVAQIARTIALALGLNETLTEAICLAHDLGHTPFGHAGQDALNACMRDHGGFEHNLQSLRIVDTLEERYADFDGLNLTFEAREGILKHCSKRNAEALGELGRRFIERTQPGAEAQLADLADAVAYNNHDVDDGLRAGLLDIDALRTEPLFDEPYREVTAKHPGLARERLIYEVKRRMIARVVYDLIDTSRAQLEAAAPADIEAVRKHGHRLVGFSEAVGENHRALKRFLYANLYNHPDVVRMQDRARDIVTALYEAYTGDPARISEDFAARVLAGAPLHRGVADYIAGMTDRFAITCHERLQG
ncbi:MAG: deoxyguanosinetriphosphate triphosphohydrolase [Pseudomonadota bacterium]